MRKLDRSSAPVLLERLSKITDDSTPLWGQFKPGPMINHLRRGLAASNGVTSFEDFSTWWLKHITKPRVMLGLKRIPRAKLKLPEHFLDLRVRPVAREVGLFEEQLKDFFELCERDKDKKTLHPYFGMMSMPEWQRWHWLHFDHHLRQFGV